MYGPSSLLSPNGMTMYPRFTVYELYAKSRFDDVLSVARPDGPCASSFQGEEIYLFENNSFVRIVPEGEILSGVNLNG